MPATPPWPRVFALRSRPQSVHLLRAVRSMWQRRQPLQPANRALVKQSNPTQLAAQIAASLRDDRALLTP